ncbi:MAG: RHS repeat-associated core domain-containing protein [Acidobacteria bacterium]|nr:RHS repeat-associated core domain-containing protein [Acidobacteriota bacterium]
MRRHDYLPFGEELQANSWGRTQAMGYAADSVRQKYTGYERDAETGLNFAEARYHSDVQGRFTSIDPLSASAKLTDPQSLNRYAYVGNSPVVFSDPSGMLGVSGFNCPGCSGIQTAQYSREIDDFTAMTPDIVEDHGWQTADVAGASGADVNTSALDGAQGQAAADSNNLMLAAVAGTQQTQEEFQASPEYPKLLQAYADELQKNVPGVGINWDRSHKIITSIDFPNDYDTTVKQLIKAGYLSGIENAAFNPVDHPFGMEFRDPGSRTCELSFHFKVLYPKDETFSVILLPPIVIKDHSPARATDIHIDRASPLYGDRGVYEHGKDFVRDKWNSLQRKFGFK